MTINFECFPASEYTYILQHPIQSIQSHTVQLHTVSNSRLLTAAQCWWDGWQQARQFTVVLGSLTLFSGGTRIVTSDVSVHPNWNANGYLNDIAMIRIPSIGFNNNIQAVPLPSLADVNQDFAGLTATISGFGKTDDFQNNFPTTSALHHTTVEVLTDRVCQNSFTFNIHNSFMCTDGSGGRGTCGGDTGGPITVIWNNRRTLVGITSFMLAEGCQSNRPSVFTRVTAFFNWINANL